MALLPESKVPCRRGTFRLSGKITDGVDTAFYGRVTYDMMESYWPTAAEQPGATRHDIEHGRWYNAAEKIVLSTKKHAQSDKVQFIDGKLKEEIGRRKHGNGKNIVVFGSPSAVHSLLKEDLIDELWLFVNPVLLGAGIPLFKDVRSRIKLRLLTSKVFSAGVAGLHYQVERS